MADLQTLKKPLIVTEIFHSIQGEGTLTGERFSFIRLTGCPLRCNYCDTTYSYSGGSKKTVEEIIEEVLSHQTNWILVTGGEPLAQKNCLSLVTTLKSTGKNIAIETDGEEDIQNYTSLAKIIMDIKTPSSGEKAEKCFKNLDFLKKTDEVKFVIQNKDDYLWAKEISKKYNLESRFTVLFSPTFNTLELKNVAEWIIEDRLNVRLQTQLHKHIWGAEEKGV